MPKLGGAESESLDLEAVREQYARLVEHQFEDLWRWSQPREKLLVLALALDDPASAPWLEEWVQRARTRCCDVGGRHKPG